MVVLDRRSQIRPAFLVLLWRGLIMSSWRFLFVLAVWLLVGPDIVAQPPIVPTNGKWLVVFEVDATPTPLPAMKYQLLPEIRDLQAGNQIPAFYKCFMEQNFLFFNKESEEDRERWHYAPLSTLAKVPNLIGYGGGAVRQAHHAARLDVVDWQIQNQIKAEGINLLLPDVQQMRRLAMVLKVRLRGEVARGEFDAALQTTQTLFALARAFNDHPTVISQIVGIAITSLTLDAVEELVQQPGAPNLFWALVDLPTPFINLRKGVQGDRTWVGKEFDVLRKAEPISESDLQILVKKIDLIVRYADSNKEFNSTWYFQQVFNSTKVAAARDRLAKLGHRPPALAALPPIQILMMDDFARYEIARDEIAKWAALPYWQTPPTLEMGSPEGGVSTRMMNSQAPEGVFIRLLPTLRKARQAQNRVQQRIAMLQVVEGLRAHAAGNAGKFPARLDEVKLPLPVDPFSGKQFCYELKGAKAVIQGTPPADDVKQPIFNRVYEITLASHDPRQ